ncbi:hypothetical protein, partial [Pseudomonas aeruginosa]|uniref:hypothetical protein n=1 Tax=Pseudomonas aeruginosa TaxID=287 RepID=UPI001E51F2ED
MEWVSLVVCVGCGLLFFLGGECATIVCFLYISAAADAGEVELFAGGVSCKLKTQLQCGVGG